MKILVFLIILGILLFFLEKIVNKLLQVEKKKISETPGKKLDQWGRGIILFIFLFTLPFMVIGDSTNFVKWYWIIYLTVLMGFQAFLQWKYLKNSKQYVSTIIFMILTVIIIFNIDNLLLLME